MRTSPILYLALISVYFIFSCHNPETSISHSLKEGKTRYDSVLDYFATRQLSALKASVTKIFVLTENGCMPCNKKFLNLLKQNLSDTSAAFVIGVSSNYFDISEIKASHTIFMDQSLLETEYRLFYQSKVIYLKNRQVDTIITIDASQIEKQFDIINNRR